MPHCSFGEPELALLREVIDSGDLWRGTEGRFVGGFEDRFAEHTGRKYVHALSAGTAANEAALFGVGIGPGDEVIVPPCSFIATSMSAVVLGAVPVFADVDPRTMGITAEAIEAALTPRAKAVVIVHLWGQPAEMDAILQVARKHDLKVVEDCAQAFDAYYHGRMVGTLGDVACYSLQQSKHITSGEGGMITTDDPEVYRRAVLYANCGMPWYRYGLEKPSAQPVAGIPTRGHFAWGHNYRMSELQGAVACAQLEKIGEFNARRREIVAAIESQIAGVNGVAPACVHPDTQPNYWVYPLWAVGWSAAELGDRVREKTGVGLGGYAEINYLESVYQQMQAERRTSLGTPLPDYVHYTPGVCPQAESAALHCIPMGCHPQVDLEAVRAQAAAIREALG
ncbi:MAG: DegT/DnrJ/EryC1/StrS family aminotransferase [Armatimonadetes bacterium]|nr:DegT/DnrJ/EryC1/StrS family aminotransferase [Armatimonadota bacterium]